MKFRIIAATLASVLALAACSLAPAVEPSTNPEPEPTAVEVTARPTRTPIPNAACIPLSPEMMAAIAAHAKNPEKFIPVSGVAVRSSTYHRSSLYVIRMAFSIGPGDPVGGTWVATSLDPSTASIYNGPSTASRFTDFPTTAADWPELRLTDDSWPVAAGCVGY